MTFLRRAWCVAFAVMWAAPAWAQSSNAVPDLASIAARLGNGLRGSASGRIAVLPVSDPGDRYGSVVIGEVTDRLRATLRAEAARRKRTWSIVDGADVSRVLAQLQLPRPIGPTGAAIVGTMLAADYVVVTTLLPADRHSRMQAALVEVSSRRAVSNVERDLGLAPSSPGGAVTMPATAPPRGFWDSRRLVLFGGLAGAAVSGALALIKNQDVRDARTRLLAVPPGASDEFNREARAARQAERTRDFWWGSALGVGGVTIAYLVASDSPNQRPQPSPVVSVPLPGKWLIEVHPAAARVWIGRAF